MANIEKHRKSAYEQIESADFGSVPMRARATHLVGPYIKNCPKDRRRRDSGVEDRAMPVIVRLEDLPATPANVERIRDSGVPYRLRVV